MEQGVVGAKTAGCERCGIDGADGGQSAVGTCLDVGLHIIERSGGVVAVAGRKSHGQQKDSQRKTEKRCMMTKHNIEQMHNSLQIYSKKSGRTTSPAAP